VVTWDSIECATLGVLTERIGRFADARVRQRCEALQVAVDCER
jgi:mRNA-degrading endonuclease toxin of MazEF toxin-antitoxin module